MFKSLLILSLIIFKVVMPVDCVRQVRLPGKQELVTTRSGKDAVILRAAIAEQEWQVKKVGCCCCVASAYSLAIAIKLFLNKKAA